MTREGSSLVDVRAPGKPDSEVREIYLYGARLKSIRSIVGLSKFANLQFLSLHNNEITRIEGLELLSSLKELNLSSNYIRVIQGLSHLSSLRALNLSCNRIQEISGLNGLHSLSKLVLSHNRIVKLGGLSDVNGPRDSLRYLDLKDNLVKSLAELWQLAECIHLEELILFHGRHTNPVCNEPGYQATVLAALPQLKLLDHQVGTPVVAAKDCFKCKTTPETSGFPPSEVVNHGNHQHQLENGSQQHEHEVNRAAQHVTEHQVVHHGSQQQVVQHQVNQVPECRVGRCTSKPSEEVHHGNQQCPGNHGTPQPASCNYHDTSNCFDHEESRHGTQHQDFQFNDGIHHRFHPPQHRRPVNQFKNTEAELSSEHENETTRRVDHELKGFVRRREFEQLTVPSAHEIGRRFGRLSVPRDHATRIGRLELHLLELVDNLKGLRTKTEASDEESDQPSSSAKRRRSRRVWRVHARRKRETKKMEESESEDDRIKQLQVELAKVKEELARRTNASLTGKENVPKLQDKPPEIEHMKDFIELLKTEVRPLGPSIREQIKAKVFTLQSETTALKEALDIATCSRQNAERALMDATAEKEAFRLSTANLSKSLDEERANLKLCNTELESCKHKEIEAYEEVKRLSTLIADERLERKSELERLTSFYEEKMREASTAAELRGKASRQMMLDSLERKLEDAEQQLLEERRRSAERCNRIAQEAQQECLNLRQALQNVLQKEKEAQASVAELTATVQSQKFRIQGLQHEMETSSALLEQSTQDFQALKKLEKHQEAKRQELASEVEHLKKQLAEASNVTKDAAAFQEEIAHIREELAESSLNLKNSEDTVRIKTKMLESQNESIRELKMEITRMKDALKEAKTSSEFMKNEWNSKLREEIEQGQALRKELAAQDVAVLELEEELKAHKAASLEDLSRLQAKLKEKDEMMRYVEREINQVKALYENREKKIAAERDEALDRLKASFKEKEIAELQARDACAQLDEMKTLQQRKEREHTSQLKLLEEQLEEKSRKSLHLETQLQEQLLAMERHKALSNSKVNQLSKVLDELRAYK